MSGFNEFASETVATTAGYLTSVLENPGKHAVTAAIASAVTRKLDMVETDKRLREAGVNVTTRELGMNQYVTAMGLF